MASSDRRIAANRINALKSTGPKTDEGKEVSRANASKHGMTAVVVVPGEEAGEADRRTERLQGQLAPDGDEMGLILARHAALLSIQVERRARNMAAMAEHRVRTAEADHADARRAEAEGLFTSIGAHGPSNHRRLLSLPEGVDLLLDQIEELRNHLQIGSAWTGAHADAFDHLTGRRYSMPLTRMAALTNLIVRDDASALAPAEAPAGDRAARWAWATAEVTKLVDAELARLRGLRAAFDPAAPAQGHAPAASRATVSDDKASLLTRKSMFAAHRAFLQTHEAIRRLRHLRRDEARQAGPAATAELRADLAWNEPNPDALPPVPVMASFRPNALRSAAPIDASTFTIGKPPIAPAPEPQPPRSTP